MRLHVSRRLRYSDLQPSLYKAFNVKAHLFLPTLWRHMRGGGSGGIAPLVLNLGSNWSCVVRLTLQPFYPRKVCRYLFNRRMGSPRGGMKDSGKKKSPISAGIRTANRPARRTFSVPRLRNVFRLSEHQKTILWQFFVFQWILNPEMVRIGWKLGRVYCCWWK